MSVSEHKSKAQKSISCFVVTVSDTRDEATDRSGQLIKTLLEEGSHRLAGYRIVKDEPSQIEALLQETFAREDVEAIILNGGTGIAPRDGTYEVVSRHLEKRLDGFGEIFRFLSFQDIGSAAIMSRALAGTAKGKLVFSLPGSKGAVDLAMRRLVLPELGHMVSQLKGR
ncbi:MAG: MogA/MoaB family molybdenum cofactor biosynthesis protein [Deltaproteobacteria bacterium]|nr:MogA/MoaB family molybdenum cofactor biosynthesis protein [Deltaproteobacteria bacterium]